MHTNNKLIHYICKLDLHKVSELLKNDSVNPNHMRQDCFFDAKERKYMLWYNKDGTEKPETDPTQPNTPLKLCVFILSNCLFSKDEKLIIVEIAKKLISVDATVDDNVINYFTSRYGKFPYHDDIFNTFYELLIQNK